VEAFLVSLTGVAIAEVGDRTQLLALVPAARFKKPWPIMGGVLCATVLNHGAAGWIGAHLGGLLRPVLLDAVVGVSMIAMALWTLRPDKLTEDAPPRSQHNVFVATFIAFFLAEIGDKPQILTVALAAAYAKVWAVVTGTSCGMLLANAPVVFFGRAFAERLPLQAIRYAAALLFLLGGGVLLWQSLQH
jgi:putative Ca2+/H+ antiporter (TMEM165/GDT1 family)